MVLTFWISSSVGVFVAALQKWIFLPFGSSRIVCGFFAGPSAIECRLFLLLQMRLCTHCRIRAALKQPRSTGKKRAYKFLFSQVFPPLMYGTFVVWVIGEPSLSIMVRRWSRTVHAEVFFSNGSRTAFPASATLARSHEVSLIFRVTGV